MALVHLEKVPKDRVEFETRVRQIAAKYGFDPNWLMIVMFFETAGKFLPGYYSTSNAVGLIQFTTVGAAQVGSNKDYLSKLSAIQQLEWVDKYYQSFNVVGKIKSLTDCYLVVFAPAFLGSSPDSVVYKKGTLYYTGNSKLDIGNKGYITVADIGAVIERYRGGYVDSVGNIGSGTVLAGFGNMGTALLALLAGGYFFKKQREKGGGNE